jgi:thymidine kinase
MSDKLGMTIIYSGGMFAKKTEKLFEHVKNECLKGQRVVMIKHALDVRYTREQLISSHDGKLMSALVANELTQDPPHISKDVNVIGIDEGQFFVGLFDFCKRWNAKGVDVVISACNTCVDRTPFPHTEIPQLVSWGATIKQCYSNCIVCGLSNGTLTRSIRPLEASVTVASDDLYVPVCCACYNTDITKEHQEQRKTNVKMMKDMFTYK